MGKMKAVEQEQLSQLAGGSGAETPATTASRGEPQGSSGGAGVEGLALAQAQRMEEVALAQAQRIAEQEDEVGKLRQAEQGYLARISELRQQMEALARRQRERNVELEAEMRKTKATEAEFVQRNVELEAM